MFLTFQSFLKVYIEYIHMSAPLDTVLQQAWLLGGSHTIDHRQLLNSTTGDDSDTATSKESYFPAAIDLVRLLVVDSDICALVSGGSDDGEDERFGKVNEDERRKVDDTALVWEFLEAEIAQMANMRCEEVAGAVSGYYTAARTILDMVNGLLDAQRSSTSVTQSSSKKGKSQKHKSNQSNNSIDMEGLLQKALSDATIQRVLPRVCESAHTTSPSGAEVSPSIHNLSVLLSCYSDKSSSNWLRPCISVAKGDGAVDTAWSPCGTIAAILFEATRLVADHHGDRPHMDVAAAPPSRRQSCSEASAESHDEHGEKKVGTTSDATVAASNFTDVVESAVVGAFFLLLGRYSDRCLPWVDTHYIKLAHAAGGSDFMRLLLQYHDPELSLHLDQHPIPRPTMRAHTQSIAFIATGVLPTVDGVDEWKLSQEAFTPRTFGEAACAFTCGMTPPSTPSTLAASVHREMVWTTAVFNRTVTCRSHVGESSPTTVRPGSSRNGHVPLVSTGECLYPVFAFLASTIHRREEILSLGDGDQLGDYWARYHPLQRSEQTGVGAPPSNRPPRFAFPPPLLFEPTTTNDEDGTLHQERINDAEIVRQAPSFHIELSEMFRSTTTTPSSLRRALSVVACESVPRVIRNTPKSSLNLLRRDILATDRCDYSTGALNDLREYLLGFVALPVSANELAASFPNRDNIAPDAEGRMILPPRDPDQLRYIILDTRSENSFLFARLPTAIHMGSDVGFDRAMMRSSLRKVNPIRFSHLTVMGTGRPIVEESNLLKFLTFSLLEGDTIQPPKIKSNDNDTTPPPATAAAPEFVGGLPYVSSVDGGFKSCVPYIKAGSMECVKSPLPPPATEGGAEEGEAKALFSEGKKVAAETFGTLSTGVSSWFTRVSAPVPGDDPTAAQPPSSSTPTPAHQPSAAVLAARAKEVGGKATESLSYAKSWGAGVWRSVADKVAKPQPVADVGVQPLQGAVVQPSSSSTTQPQWGSPTPVAPQPVIQTPVTNETAPGPSQPADEGRFWKFFAATAVTGSAAAPAGSEGVVESTTPTVATAPEAATTTANNRKLFDLSSTSGGAASATNVDDDDDDDLDLILSIGNAAEVVTTPTPTVSDPTAPKEEEAPVTTPNQPTVPPKVDTVASSSPPPASPPKPQTSASSKPKSSASPHPFDDIFGDF